MHVRALVVSLALLAACERGHTREPDPGAEPVTREACGEPGERFVDLRWVPSDARLLLLVDRRASDLGPALARAGELSRHAGTAGLPVRAGLALGSLRMQVDMLALSLRELGADPGELVELHGPASELAWVWPSTCASDRLAARMLAQWGVMLRARVDARLGSAGEQYPFDVVVLPGGEVALAPRGQGAALLRWLQGADASDEGPGSRTTALAPAAIRGLVQGESLLAGEAAASGGGPTHARTLRVTGEQVELDGMVFAPPP
jgi:hypothetical protein